MPRSAMSEHKTRTIYILAIGLVITIIAALSFLIGLIIVLTDKAGNNEGLPPWPSPSASPLGIFSKAAIAADNGVCSEIGRDIMIRGGNAVDAAVAATFCVGVMDAHSAGIGGGHVMTIYNRTTKSCFIIDARETAPASAHRDMYVNQTSDASSRGWASIGVPGEVYGLRKAYEIAGSGRIEWADLLKPTIDFCRNGYVVSGALGKAIRDKTDMLLNETTMKDLYFNKDANRTYQSGEVMRRPVLADTLEALANSPDPIGLFYKGNLTKKFIQDFQDNNANITLEDFANYAARFGPQQRPAIATKINGMNLIACGPPPPSSAAIAISIVKILSFYNITPTYLNESLSNNVETYHRLIEAMKYAYASRERLGDMDFVPDALTLAKEFTSDSFVARASASISEKAKDDENSYFLISEPVGAAAVEDHGTVHISVVDADGNAVSLTSTINLHFGSMRRSVSTDIIWNDEMDDFSTPGGDDNAFGYEPSTFNYIEPGKRPLSSMSPIVIYDNATGHAEIAAGAAGGSRIISSTASVITRLLWFGQNLKDAVDFPRLHNQLHPFTTEYEKGFPQSYVDKLTEKGQIMTLPEDFAVVCAVVRCNNRLHAYSDSRKAGGYPAGY